jgi:ATP-dependent DNA ligase
MTRFERVRFIEFLKPVTAARPPGGENWIHEIKYDGYRTQVLIECGQAKAYSKNGHDWTGRYEPIARAARQLPCKSAVIDGEVIINNDLGVSDFSKLQRNLGKGDPDLLFMAFDLLHLDGYDLTHEPLIKRKEALQHLLKDTSAPIIYTEHLITNGQTFFEACERLGLEGMISKRPESTYKSGRSQCWLKTKCYVTKDFDIAGTATTKDGRYVALLKTRDTGVIAGSAFINLTRKKREMLSDRIRDLRTHQPLAKSSKYKQLSFLKPGLVASVKHLRGEESLRHASITDIWDETDDL